MEMGKNIALIALGAAAVIAYNCYHKPVMEKLEQTTEKALKKLNGKLDNMM